MSRFSLDRPRHTSTHLDRPRQTSTARALVFALFLVHDCTWGAFSQHSNDFTLENHIQPVLVFSTCSTFISTQSRCLTSASAMKHNHEVQYIMRSSTIPAHAAHTWMPIELKTGDARAVGFERSKVTKATQQQRRQKRQSTNSERRLQVNETDQDHMPTHECH